MPKTKKLCFSLSFFHSFGNKLRQRKMKLPFKTKMNKQSQTTKTIQEGHVEQCFERIKAPNSLSVCLNPLTFSEYWIRWFCWMKPSRTIMKNVFSPLKLIYFMVYCMLNKPLFFSVCQTSKSLNALPHALDSAEQTFHFWSAEVVGLQGYMGI